MPRDGVSTPAHSADDKPPSPASDATMLPDAASANRRSARYKFDFPEPFGPDTTFSAPNGAMIERTER
jgi:hypothetical protein